MSDLVLPSLWVPERRIRKPSFNFIRNLMSPMPGRMVSNKETPAYVLPTGYQGRYDASQITGFADGASLTSWADISGNGRTASPFSTAATYYKTTAGKLVNGLPAVWFAGGNDTDYEASASLNANTYVYFVVASAPATANQQYFFNSIYANGGSPYYYAVYKDGSVYTSSTAAGTGAHTFCVESHGTGAATNFYVDGVIVASSTPAAANNITTLYIAGTQFHNGCLNAGGFICEMVTYTSLSTPNIAEANGYLMSKWAT